MQRARVHKGSVVNMQKISIDLTLAKCTTSSQFLSEFLFQEDSLGRGFGFYGKFLAERLMTNPWRVSLGCGRITLSAFLASLLLQLY